MSVLLIVPARYASSRFPGKPLVPLRGASGITKSLVQRAWEAACGAPGIARIVVATDDPRIAAHVREFGGEAVMTPESCRNGTERCAAAASVLPGYDIIINLQGDAPLTPPAFVAALASAARDRPDAALATPVLRCEPKVLERLRADRRAGRVGGTTAVFDRNGLALYFSKEVLPYAGPTAQADAFETPVFHHVGAYAYRRDALLAYPDLPEGPLEALEGLEQLRFLENRLPVLCVEVEAPGRTFWEVNNPEDVPLVEAALTELGIE